MGFDVTFSLLLGCRERQSLTPIRGTCGLLSDWSSVGVKGYPVVSIFDGCFSLGEGVGKGRGELGTRIMYQILIRGVRVCC
jgi:hypothetical protein